MNPFKAKIPTKPKRSTSTGSMVNQQPKPVKIRKPNIKTPSATQILQVGTPGDNQNFNK